jgi:hypothetical protein
MISYSLEESTEKGYVGKFVITCTMKDQVTSIRRLVEELEILERKLLE